MLFGPFYPRMRSSRKMAPKITLPTKKQLHARNGDRGDPRVPSFKSICSTDCRVAHNISTNIQLCDIKRNNLLLHHRVGFVINKNFYASSRVKSWLTGVVLNVMNQFPLCPFCRCELTVDNVSLDRKDGCRGHLCLKNVIVTCIACNVARCCLPAPVFSAFADFKAAKKNSPFIVSSTATIWQLFQHGNLALPDINHPVFGANMGDVSRGFCRVPRLPQPDIHARKQLDGSFVVDGVNVEAPHVWKAQLVVAYTTFLRYVGLKRDNKYVVLTVELFVAQLVNPQSYVRRWLRRRGVEVEGELRLSRRTFLHWCQSLDMARWTGRYFTPALSQNAALRKELFGGSAGTAPTGSKKAAAARPLFEHTAVQKKTYKAEQLKSKFFIGTGAVPDECRIIDGKIYYRVNGGVLTDISNKLRPADHKAWFLERRVDAERDVGAPPPPSTSSRVAVHPRPTQLARWLACILTQCIERRVGCSYCGYVGPKLSFDRLNNSGSHVDLENVTPCCSACKWIRNNSCSPADMHVVVYLMHRYNGGKLDVGDRIRVPAAVLNKKTPAVWDLALAGKIVVPSIEAVSDHSCVLNGDDLALHQCRFPKRWSESERYWPGTLRKYNHQTSGVFDLRREECG